MSHAIRIHETGSPEVMRWEEVGAGGTAPLAPGEARVRHAAIGLNFIDNLAARQTTGSSVLLP